MGPEILDAVVQFKDEKNHTMKMNIYYILEQDTTADAVFS